MVISGVTQSRIIFTKEEILSGERASGAARKPVLFHQVADKPEQKAALLSSYRPPAYYAQIINGHTLAFYDLSCQGSLFSRVFIKSIVFLKH